MLLYLISSSLQLHHHALHGATLVSLLLQELILLLSDLLLAVDNILADHTLILCFPTLLECIHVGWCAGLRGD